MTWAKLGESFCSGTLFRVKVNQPTFFALAVDRNLRLHFGDVRAERSGLRTPLSFEKSLIQSDSGRGNSLIVISDENSISNKLVSNQLGQTFNRNDIVSRGSAGDQPLKEVPSSLRTPGSVPSKPTPSIKIFLTQCCENSMRSFGSGESPLSHHSPKRGAICARIRCTASARSTSSCKSCWAVRQ